MRSYIQILSTPTADTPGTTLLLHFDAQRYLIGNVAEGTQRVCVQRSIPLQKVANILLTGTTNWGTTGGIMGMILTLADAATNAWQARKEVADKTRQKKISQGKTVADEIEEPKRLLNIFGGKNLTHLLATARRFIFRKGMPLEFTEFKAGMDAPKENWAPTWQDNYIKVWTMILEPEIKSNPASPRKRSHDEFKKDYPMDSGDTEVNEDLENENDQIRKSVVGQMFGSDWQMDALIKKKLSEVERPAEIFCRDEEGKIQKYTGPTLDEDSSVLDTDVLVRNPWPGALVAELPPTEPSTTSICYIIRNHPQRGKFNPKVAKELGVKSGPDYATLSEGRNVTTKDGKVVTPGQVMGPSRQGAGFAVVDLSNTSYIASLIARPEWSAKEVMDGIGAIVWILGPGVLEDARLQKFMQEKKELKHIVSGEDCCSNYLALESPASAAIRLHLLDAERFPIPKHSNAEIETSADSNSFIRARPGLTLTLEPRIELRPATIVPYLDTEAVVMEANEEVLRLSNEGRKHIESAEFRAALEKSQEDIPSKDAEITTLGTGSALPSKYRNVSATLLRVPGYGSYLFDCGENTLGQLKRVYGDELPEILKDLKAIWISHLHADHHLGTVSVIKEWAAVTAKQDSAKENTLIVASDEAMINWLIEYSSVEDYGFDRVEAIKMHRQDDFFVAFPAEQTAQYGLESIKACQVRHCHRALAVVFTFPNGFKVAYSGDCRPSDEFAQIGKGATLLIHEATFDDEFSGDAIAKRHSTTSEALEVGKNMGAKRILLTHFSQRYQKIPVMNRDDGEQVAIVAFDYMKCKIGDFAKVEAFKPALMELYKDVDSQ